MYHEISLWKKHMSLCKTRLYCEVHIAWSNCECVNIVIWIVWYSIVWNYVKYLRILFVWIVFNLAYIGFQPMKSEHSEPFSFITVQYLGGDTASIYPPNFENLQWVDMHTGLRLSGLLWDYLPPPRDRPPFTTGVMDFSQEQVHHGLNTQMHPGLSWRTHPVLKRGGWGTL